MNMFEKFHKEIVLTSVLFLSGVFFSISLYSLNQELLKLSILQMLLYKEGIIWFYLLFWIILMILTAYTLCSACKSLRNIETGTDLILLIILIVVTVIIGSVTIYLIQNPILRAIGVAIILVGAFSSTG